MEAAEASSSSGVTSQSIDASLSAGVFGYNWGNKQYNNEEYYKAIKESEKGRKPDVSAETNMIVLPTPGVENVDDSLSHTTSSNTARKPPVVSAPSQRGSVLELELDEQEVARLFNLTAATEQQLLCPPKKKQKTHSEPKQKPAESATNSQPEVKEKKKLVPRKYQEELLNESRSGNVIAVAPTGAGKTLIAVLLVQDVLRTNPDKKVLFVVNQIPLVNQQGSVFESLLEEPYCNRVGKFHSEKGFKDWQRVMRQFDVIVSTVQLFVNGLKANEVWLSHFQLIIFDECHHTISRHPYRTLMREYYLPAKSLSPHSLPKILGLSASPAAKNTTGETLVRLLQLGHDLDCKIRKVIQNDHELRDIINMPQLVTVTVKMDEAASAIRGLILVAMKQVKAAMGKFLEKGAENDDIDLDTEFAEDGIGFDQWVGEVKDKYGYDEVSSTSDFQPLDIYEENLKRFIGLKQSFDMNRRNMSQNSNNFLMLLDTLTVLNECMVINDNRSARAAWKQLVAFMEILEPESVVMNIFRKLKLTKSTFNLEKLPNFCQKNVELVGILKRYAESENFKCLVFAKTRIAAIELQEFLSNSELKDKLKVKTLLGHGHSSTSGMTAFKQKEILAEFHRGDVNVLVATSVAEEGLDVPTCKLVVRLHAVENALQLIQTRGRARNRESEFYCISHAQSGDHKKITRCILQEKKMLRAIDMLLAAEKHNNDVYKHSENSVLTLSASGDKTTIKDSAKHVTISHLLKLIWDYNERPVVEDDICDDLYGQHISKQQEQQLLQNTAEKLLGVRPEYHIYRTQQHPPVYFGTVVLRVPGMKIVFTAKEDAKTVKEAKRKAAAYAVAEFKRKDLLIYPTNSWLDVFKGSEEEATSAPKKKKKKKKAVPTVNARDVLTPEVGCAIIHYHCTTTYNKEVKYKEVACFVEYQPGKMHYKVIAQLPDGTVSAESDIHPGKKDGKKEAAFRLCKKLIFEENVNIEVPKTLMDSLLKQLAGESTQKKKKENATKVKIVQ